MPFKQHKQKISILAYVQGYWYQLILSNYRNKLKYAKFVINTAF